MRIGAQPVSVGPAGPAGSTGPSGSAATDTIFDAKGDLAIGTGSDTAAKLTVGTNNYVLTADSSQTTGVKWAAAAGGASETLTAVKTAAYTASAGDIVPVNTTTNGSLTITLPSAPSSGATVTVKNVGINTAVVVAQGGATIDTATQAQIQGYGSLAQFTYDGTNWYITRSSGIVSATTTGPILRSTTVAFVNNTNTVNATLPAGTLLNDHMLICVSHGYTPSLGGTVNALTSNSLYWKVVSSTDITNGYYQVTFSGSFYGVVGLATVTGANAAPIRGSEVTTASTAVLFVTSSAPTLSIPGDLRIVWGSGRFDNALGVSMSANAGAADGSEKLAVHASTTNVQYIGTFGSRVSERVTSQHSTVATATAFNGARGDVYTAVFKA